MARKQVEVKINNIDVTASLTRIIDEDTIEKDIDKIKLFFLPTIFDLIDDVTSGLTLEVWEGYTTPTDEKVFSGFVVKIQKSPKSIQVTGYDKLWQLVRREVSKVYDKDVDPSAGKISEVFDDLVTTYGGLNADSGTIQDSGTTVILDKFVCRNADVFERCKALADILDWQFYYKASDDKVYFEPRGYLTNTKVVYIGGANNNVVNIPKWIENMKELINIVEVLGARQIVETTEFESGDGSTKVFSIDNTPVSVKVFVATTLKKGGLEGSTTSADYYVDAEAKTIEFVVAPPVAVDNIEIRYGYGIPTPVLREDSVSKDTYGESKKTITLTDVKLVEDAETRAQNILSIFSTPFVTTKIFVKPDVAESLGMKVGQQIRVVDVKTIPNKDTFVTIQRMVRKFPEKNVEIIIGDREIRMGQFEEDVLLKLKRLEELIRENQDIILIIRDQPSDIILGPREFMILETNVGTSWIWGQSIWGTDKWGAAGTSSSIIRIVHPNLTYGEYFYDDYYEDSSSTTANWDTSGEKISFTGAQQAQSNTIAMNSVNITRATLTADDDGNLVYSLSNDDGSTWETVTSGTEHVFTSTGQLLKFKVVSSATTEIRAPMTISYVEA